MTDTADVDQFDRARSIDVAGFDRGLLVLPSVRQVVCWGDKGVRWMGLRDFAAVQEFPTSQPVQAAATDADGAVLALVLKGASTIQLVDAATRQVTRELRSSGPAVQHLTVSAAGQYVLAVDTTGDVHHWSVEQGSLWQTLHGARSVSAAAIYLEPRRSLGKASTPTRVLTGGEDGKVRLWQLDSGQMVKEMPALDWTPVTALLLVPGVHDVLVGGASGEAVLLDLEGSRVSRKVKLGSQPVFALASLADGRFALLGDGSGALAGWDLVTGKCRMQPQSHAGA